MRRAKYRFQSKDSLILAVNGLRGGVLDALDSLAARTQAACVTTASTIGLWSLAIAVITLLPKVENGFPQSDGAWIRALVKPGPDVGRWLAVLVLQSSSISGLRPREWDPAVVAVALEKSPGTCTMPPSMRYNWYADTKQTEEAKRELDGILSQPCPAAMPLAWWNGWWFEAAWFALHAQGNLEEARKCMQVAESLSQPQENQAWRWRALVVGGDKRCAISANE